MNEIFTLRHQHQCHLRNRSVFCVPKSFNRGQSVRYLGRKVLEIIPTHVKESDIIGKFKTALKIRKQESCPFKLYLQNIDRNHNADCLNLRKKLYRLKDMQVGCGLLR